jgi:Leu/Phe-tRNA-protein transferase
VLFPAELHLSASLRRTLRRHLYTVSADRCFTAVIGACAAPRARTAATWIGAGMRAAYCELHRLGHAHSIETGGGNWSAGYTGSRSGAFGELSPRHEPRRSHWRTSCGSCARGASR